MSSEILRQEACANFWDRAAAYGMYCDTHDWKYDAPEELIAKFEKFLKQLKADLKKAEEG